MVSIKKTNFYKCLVLGCIAQLAERGAVNSDAVGSSPTTPAVILGIIQIVLSELNEQFDFLKNICYNIYITNEKVIHKVREVSP